MIVAAILAGGSGVRMGNPDKPKQYYQLGTKPVLAHTIDKFCAHGQFDVVLVLCPETWLQQTRDLIERYCPEYSNGVHVAAGGQSRTDTVLKAIEWVDIHCEVEDDSIIVTHDAVRPFVSLRIISDNIEAAERFGACDTVIPATDTIVASENAATISEIPDRRNLYQGQTPQSFKLAKLKEVLLSLSDAEKEILTDACKAFVLRGEPVELVKGDIANFKITYPHDMRVAHAMLGVDEC
ncbi:IspD/TarI family cytidylyltransferase [Raoultibacter timonensis]|uniref:IspD/TarI family cytidylyltransferase n=1 Tax=Raoultibacter timonensis TaxID=1907662 RepID=UPI000C85CF8B|nr:2-C-methyl-D-erythritol 4-phosphate cytidylyltransferase [Raoultibacter timonensis]